MKFDVTLSGFSKSLDVRQVRQQIAEIKKAQLLRQKRLRSLIAMSNYAKSKGVSVSEMTSLTKENLSENKRRFFILNVFISLPLFPYLNGYWFNHSNRREKGR